ncbi:MAG: 50S ribosomal protein L17 [candidate division Zixibacteria bacterium]|nr:50S ribosomal protein L17 [candidate division Zixibacteria bacterium]
MGHRDKVKKLGRTKPHRESMLANMAMSLIQHRMIKTTEAKAKALRPVIDRLITTAKKGTLASKRQVAETLHVKEIFKKFYDEIVPQFADRDSGYTRIMKLGVRRGDGAPISVVELMIEKPKVEKDAKKKDKKTAKAAAK